MKAEQEPWGGTAVIPTKIGEWEEGLITRVTKKQA